MTEQEKRERLIEAACKVLAEKGYDQASTKEIANEAGVAQGLIGYYFQSKDMLFAEVFQREYVKYCQSMSKLKNQADQPLTPELIRNVLNVPKSRAVDNPSSIKLRYELYALGLRNPAVSDTIQSTLDRKRAHLAELIESIGKLTEEDARKLAPILLSVFDGIGLQQLCDDRFDFEGAYDTLANMIDAYVKSISKQK